MQNWKIVVPMVLLFGVSSAGAQGWVTAAPVTKAQSVPGAADDQPVKLRGQIVAQESAERYVFSDGTADVLVRVDDRQINGSLAAGTSVEIVGEVDNRSGRPQVDARSVTVLAAGPQLSPVYEDYHHNTPD